MKKQISAFLLAFLMLSLSGCSNETSVTETTTDTSATETISETTTSETTTTKANTQSTSVTSETTETSAEIVNEKIPQSYGEILRDIYYDYNFYDFQKLQADWLSGYDMNNNTFAVYDVDNDGNDELVVLFTQTATAGERGFVYGYDSAGSIMIEFLAFPSFIFFDNGIIKVKAAHNQGLAGDFWAYSMHQYDSETNSYNEVGFVDAWDKSMTEGDLFPDDKIYPDEIDVSNSGFVYYICTEGNFKSDVQPVDVTEYNAWHDSYVGGANIIELPYMYMNEENVNSIE